LVLRVRFTTSPTLMMRSNSKQPFWLTGDMAVMLSNRGFDGVSSFKPGVRLAGACSSSVAAMAAPYINCGGVRNGSCNGWLQCSIGGRSTARGKQEKCMGLIRTMEHGRGCYK